MTQVYEDMNDWSNSVKNSSSNTLLFENSCDITEYKNEELQTFETSNRKLKLFDIVFITKYYKELMDSAIKMVIQPKDYALYYRNPKKLSYDRYGTIDYWYLILIMNNWSSAYDMSELNQSILMPDPTKVSEILNNEEYIKNN